MQKLLSTAEGQRLLRLLSGDGGAAMKRAGEALKRGDTQEVQSILAPLIGDPEVQRLLKNMESAMKHG